LKQVFAAIGSKRLPPDLKTAGLFNIFTSMQMGKRKQPFAESAIGSKSLPKVQQWTSLPGCLKSLP
jgi:hypothetical protein